MVNSPIVTERGVAALMFDVTGILTCVPTLVQTPNDPDAVVQVWVRPSVRPLGIVMTIYPPLLIGFNVVKEKV